MQLSNLDPSMGFIALPSHKALDIYIRYYKLTWLLSLYLMGIIDEFSSVSDF